MTDKKKKPEELITTGKVSLGTLLSKIGKKVEDRDKKGKKKKKPLG